jgi:hypothetical protein
LRQQQSKHSIPPSSPLPRRFLNSLSTTKLLLGYTLPPCCSMKILAQYVTYILPYPTIPAKPSLSSSTIRSATSTSNPTNKPSHASMTRSLPSNNRAIYVSVKLKHPYENSPAISTP